LFGGQLKFKMASGSKHRSANSFCISLTDVKFKITPKSLTRDLISYSV
jgi:hypothetical protein